MRSGTGSTRKRHDDSGGPSSNIREARESEGPGEALRHQSKDRGKVEEALLDGMPDCRILHADEGCDTNAIRRQIEGRGAMPNIPSKANRRWNSCF